MGTAGAIKLAREHLGSARQFLVMNGDSFLEVDFRELFRFHQVHKGLATMAVRRVEDSARYGTVTVDEANRVTGFRERSSEKNAGLINAGIYVFNRDIFDHIPEGSASLERDVFPNVLDRNVYAMEHRGMFIDIGIPEDYARAQAIYDRLWSAALSK